MTTRREFLSVWPALLLERPFDGTYGDGHLHDPSQIRGFFPDTTFLGDIRSFNWDGGSDLSLLWDEGATEGLFIDMSEGSAQFMGDTFFGGNVYLLASANILFDEGTGSAGSINNVITSGRHNMTIKPSERDDGTITHAALVLFDWLSGTDAADAVVARIHDPFNGAFGIDLLADDTLRFTQDPDTYWKRTAADQQSFFSGAVEMLRLTESTADVVNVGPSSEVDLQVGGSSVGRGVLGYAAVTADQTGIGAGTTALTGLTTTVTVDASRRIKVTGFVSNWQITSGGAAADGSIFRIRETTTGLQDLFFNWAATPTGGNAYPGGTMMSVILTPSAGSHTYNLAHVRVFGTPTVSMLANASWPAFVLVEDIGAA